MTLIEILVSITLTLVILTTVITIFGLITGAVAESRAKMALVDRQRGATSRLQADLQGHTVLTLPWQRPESASGYFEYVDGAGTDISPEVRNFTTAGSGLQKLVESGVMGDVDDVLMLTVRSRSVPFRGRGPNGTVIESQVAEVVWFVSLAPADLGLAVRPLNLYRRELLVVGPEQLLPGSNIEQFQRDYDISAHMEDGQIVANTLADLTKPENRFAHQGTSGLLVVEGNPQLQPFDEASGRLGEDVILNNCVAFDVQGFSSRANGGSGGYLDLPNGFSTWSFHVEHDGSGGAPTDGAGAKTSPPNDEPLRGVQVSVRAYEPDSRQVNNVTVRGDFMPE